MDILEKPDIRSIGVLADIHQGKTNLIQCAIKSIREKYVAKMYSYGLPTHNEGVVKINSIEELEKITNSWIFIDEFPSLFSLSNRRQIELFERSMSLVFQANVNNRILICGHPHSFNKFLGALLQIMIFKQITLSDLIQRSPTERVIAAYSSDMGSIVQKGSRVLAMPKNIALVYDAVTGHYSEVEIKYMQETDMKLFAKPIMTPREKIKAS
jgi:hypothetical protein